MKIIPRIGMSDVRFGMTQDEIKTIVGEAEEIATDDCGDGDKSVAWYYWSRGYSFSFHSGVQWRMDTIEVSGASASIEDSFLVGKDSSQLMDFLRTNNLEGHVKESGLVYVEKWDMNFWIEDGKVDSIQWSVPIGDDDNELWPSA